MITLPAGIDTDYNARCSAIADDWARRTFSNREGRVGEPIARLRASFATGVQMGDSLVGITSDGIGTKCEGAERADRYSTLGFDLVAMVVDDLASSGFVPTSVSNILDVDRLDSSVIDAVMEGLHDAAVKAEVAVTGGEIAELGSRVGGWGEAELAVSAKKT